MGLLEERCASLQPSEPSLSPAPTSFFKICLVIHSCFTLPTQLLVPCPFLSSLPFTSPVPFSHFSFLLPSLCPSELPSHSSQSLCLGFLCSLSLSDLLCSHTGCLSDHGYRAPPPPPPPGRGDQFFRPEIAQATAFLTSVPAAKLQLVGIWASPPGSSSYFHD